MSPAKDVIHATNADRVSASTVPLIINIGTNGGKWSASRPDGFAPEERTPVPTEKRARTALISDIFLG